MLSAHTSESTHSNNQPWMKTHQQDVWGNVLWIIIIAMWFVVTLETRSERAVTCWQSWRLLTLWQVSAQHPYLVIWRKKDSRQSIQINTCFPSLQWDSDWPDQNYFNQRPVSYLQNCTALFRTDAIVWTMKCQ